MPPSRKPSVKARLARAFLNFLDEHGGYRTQLEEAAARAAAAEANSLFARDRRGRRKKKRRKRGKLKDGEEEEEEEEWEQLISPEEEEAAHENELPDDPYEQIQFYFRTFTRRTRQQIDERLVDYRNATEEWMHDELHHPARVPILSGAMLAASCLLCAWRVRRRKISKVARLHGILGKKLVLTDYLHTNLIKGRLMLRYSVEGGKTLQKLSEKATKAEEAALASMRPYQRKKYERFCRLERWWERCVTGCLLLGMLASGTTLVMSLNSLMTGDFSRGANNSSTTDFQEGERLDGHIYSLDGPTDSDGYPVGMRELAEENYAACLTEAEENGVDDPTIVCDVNSFFDAAVNDNATTDHEATSSSLRSKINVFLTTKLRIPPALADYLTNLGTQTIAYLSSLLTFLLFLGSHYVAHKIHVATMANDPMKHFVLASTDSTVKADGTVAAKRGETEAQRKRRERMLQNERMKAKMAQLAMEAKQRVAQRRVRMEEADKEKREAEEKARKEAEEGEEIMKMHSRQFMMIKAGVPDGAILNSFLAEGIENEEGKEIIEKLKAAKARMGEEARKAEEAEANKVEEEKKAREEEDRVAAERLRMMKKGGSMRRSNSRVSFGAPVASTVASPTTVGAGGEGSVVSATSTISTKTSSKRDINPAAAKSAMLGQIARAGSQKNVADPAAAKSAMLGQIAQAGSQKNVAKPAVAKSPAAAKSAMLGQIGGGQGGLRSAALRKTPSRIASTPAPRPGSSTIVSGNLPVGAKSDKRWDRGSRTWVDASPGGGEGGTPGSGKETPKRTNKAESAAAAPVRKVPSRLQLGADEGEEEKKGEEEWNDAPRELPQSVTPTMSSPTGTTTPMASNVAAPEEATAVPPEAPPEGEDTPAMAAAKEKQLVSKFFAGANAPAPSRARAIKMGEANESTAVEEKGADPPEEASGLSAATPDLVRVLSPEDQKGTSPMPLAMPAKAPTSLSSAAASNNNAFDALSFRRPSARDIQATIAAVERAPELPPAAEGNNGGGADLAPGWLHSPAFESALRNSNASWDKRPSSRDVAARIRAVEEFEEARELREAPQAQTEQVGAEKERGVPQSRQQQQQQQTPRPRSFLQQQQGEDSLAIIDEVQKIEPTSSFEFRRKASKSGDGGSDDEISELSEPSYITTESNALKGRSIPRALELSPMANSTVSALSPLNVTRKMLTKDIMASEPPNLDLPPMMMRGANKEEARIATDGDVAVKPSNLSVKLDAACGKSEEPAAKAETEEERKRRERAEARAKKMEAIAARRNAGKDDDESAVSGLSKRHRRRRKKAAAAAAPEESVVSAKSLDAPAEEVVAAPSKEETEEEQQRRRRAEARARKLEAMAARREMGQDDGTAVTGISRRHRARRKKSALLAAVTPEERDRRERAEWSKGIYASALNAERTKWKRTIYSHVLNAEATKTKNLEEQRRIEEQDAAARQKAEHQRRLDEKAKKFAARAERFHKMRRERNDDDDDDASAAGGSVVSSASKHHRRRRRGRKSAPSSSRHGSLANEPVGEEETPAAEPAALTAEEKEKRERKRWCSGIYVTALQAEQTQWKNNIYDHALRAEESKKKRLEKEVQIARERAAHEARREKERQNELRARKMEEMKRIRGAGGVEADDDDQSVVSAVGAPSSLKKMRNRRRRAARKSVSKSLSTPSPAPAGMRNDEIVTPLVEETTVAASDKAAAVLAPATKVPTAEEEEKRERECWCKSIYITALLAERTQWKNNIYGHALRAEEAKRERLEEEARMARERAACEARREKERQNELRARKMEEMKRIRDSGARGVDEVVGPAVDGQHPSVSCPVGGGSLKKMRHRRRRAARKSVAK